MQVLLFWMAVGLSAGQFIELSMANYSTQLQQQQLQQQQQSINQTNMPESKRIEPVWSAASPPDFTPIHEPLSPPNLHPTDFFLPGNYLAVPPIPTTEFRNEHYAYPFEPGYPYSVGQPPVDASLVPTAKHFVIVSFIGLLLLFAIIQNSIATARRKDALVEVLANRKKRDLLSPSSLQTMTPEVESALAEDARIRCIQRTLCLQNRKLLEDLGIFGKLLANYLTRTVQQNFKNVTPGWDRLVEDAAKAGLRNEDCDVIYRDCNPEISNKTETAEVGEEE